MDPEMRILNDLPLYKLVRLELYPEYNHLQAYQNAALLARRVWTLAIGDEQCLARSRESKLWHPFQNDVDLFPGGWYHTLHLSYSGYIQVLTPALCQSFIRKFPWVSTLNIMFSCVRPIKVSPNQSTSTTINFAQLLTLIRHYGAQLETFKLWAYGRLCIDNQGKLRSELFQDFVPNLFEHMRRLSGLRTLWLDLTDVPDVPFPPNCFPHNAPVVSLEGLFWNPKNFPWLREFRYATSSGPLENARALAVLVDPRLAFLQRIHFTSALSFENLRTLEPNIALKFREINVIVGPSADGNLAQFFTLFHALTRVDVQLAPNGPSFLELFYALSNVPQLGVLKVSINRSPLFTLKEAQDMFIAQNRPAPLHALQILDIRMNIRMDSCADVSFETLFENQPGMPPFDRIPMPNLVCFKMWIQQSGLCRDCGYDLCVQRAVNQWFGLLERTVFVECTIEWHKGHGRKLVIGGYLPVAGNIAFQRIPQELHQ